MGNTERGMEHAYQERVESNGTINKHCDGNIFCFLKLTASRMQERL
jgi:hypothetical protein